MTLLKVGKIMLNLDKFVAATEPSGPESSQRYMIYMSGGQNLEVRNSDCPYEEFLEALFEL